MADDWGTSDTPCTCHGFGHDPYNPDCDRAILDNTAAPTFYAVNPKEHRLQNLNAEGDIARCLDCGDVITGDNPLAIHMRDLRRRKA